MRNHKKRKKITAGGKNLKVIMSDFNRKNIIEKQKERGEMQRSGIMK